MRRSIALTLAAVAAAVTFVPLQSASAYCDPDFFAHTGYCNSCQLVAAHTHRPNPPFCPL